MSVNSWQTYDKVDPAIQYLRRRRIDLGLTIGEVATRLHVVHGTVWAWEAGERIPRLADVRLWANVLDCDLDLTPRREIPSQVDIDFNVEVDRAVAGVPNPSALTAPIRRAATAKLTRMGWSAAQIAARLGVKESTIDAYRIEQAAQRATCVCRTPVARVPATRQLVDR